jgi:macrolide transport system ATP-binding/permease protein
VNPISRIRSVLRNLFRKQRVEKLLDDEVRAYVEMITDERIATGIPASEARRSAVTEFGPIEQVKQSVRDRRAGLGIELFWQDARFGLRQLWRNPGFAATAIVVLALGIASSVAIFAFVDAALIKPLPYKDPNQLVILFESIPLGPRFHLSYPDYLDWKRENKVFSSLEVYAPYGFMMKTVDGLRNTDGARVSAGFFRTLGVKPELGRDFYDGEDRAETPRTALLSYSAWQKRYGGSSKVIGQAVVLDGDTYTVIGVLPRDFSFSPAEPAEIWAIQKAGDTCRGCHGLFGVARLKDGVTFSAAFADITTIAQNLSKQYPDSNRDQAAFMLPLAEVVVGDIRPILLVVLSGAGLLLMIASLNIASLLLVRSESRRREMAVRGALGASPRRLVAQYITEGTMLAVIGCALGVALAQQGMRMLALLVPKDMMAGMPFLNGLGLNMRVTAFACVLAIFAAALFALTPILRFRFTDIRDSLAEGGRAVAGVMWRRFGANLVVIELATAMILLVGAGLLGKSLYRLLHTDIGMQPDHIATVHVFAQPEKYGKPEQQVALVREILRRVESLPGVRSAGVTSRMPIDDGDGTTGFIIVGQPDDGKNKEVAIRLVSAGYMATLKTSLLSGRYFKDDEDSSKPGVVIINQALAKQYFAGEDPVGKQLAFDSKDKTRMLVVGVINDIQEGQLDAKPRGAMYLPFYQNPSGGFVVLARTTQDDRRTLPALASTIASVDGSMAIFNPMTMSEKIHEAPVTYLHRSSSWLMGGFAGMALLLSVVGLYGVISYSVSQRTREIGVRMALGAQRSSVYRLILFEAGRLVAVGVTVGLISAVGAASLMRKLLFGVHAWDAMTLTTVAGLLACVALLATFLPAHRAASANPMDALRAE